MMDMVIGDEVVDMKRKFSKYPKSKIYSWYVGEPSAAEYGEALSEGHRRMQERYAPFRVSDVYFNSWSTNLSGYRITLKGDNINTAGELEWIAHRDSSSFNKSYKLYGPFYPNEIQSLHELFNTQPLDETFRSLNSVMTYLFEEYDIEE